MNLVAVSGKIGSGKSTFCEFLSEALREEKQEVEIKNFADKLKRITYELTGHYGYTQEDKNVFLPDWGRTVGEILQQLGTQVMREHFDKNVWVKATLSNLNEETYYILGDCRFPNEVEAVKQRGGITIRLEGDPALVRENSNRDINHLSETSLDNYESFDYIYENNKSLEDLKIFAREVAKNLMSKKNDYIEISTIVLKFNEPTKDGNVYSLNSFGDLKDWKQNFNLLDHFVKEVPFYLDSDDAIPLKFIDNSGNLKMVQRPSPGKAKVYIDEKEQVLKADISVMTKDAIDIIKNLKLFETTVSYRTCGTGIVNDNHEVTDFIIESVCLTNKPS